MPEGLWTCVPPLLIAAGLALLWLGAELVVRGATQVALGLGVRPLLLGLTVVSIGTSAPELAIGLVANLQGDGSLAVGNIAGTNRVNLLLILGLSAWLRPMQLELRLLQLELPVMALAALGLTALAWDGELSRLEGAALVCASIAYTAVLIRASRRESGAVRKEFKQAYAAENGSDCAGARARPLRPAADVCRIARRRSGLLDGAPRLPAGRRELRGWLRAVSERSALADLSRA